jgi:predicted transcriptional regulator
MKAVLISIQPKWVKKIANGEKTIEVRKTKPNLETPFKVYIYCTKEKYKVDALHIFPNGRIEGWQLETANIFGEYGNERVIGEFVCDKIFPIQIFLKGNIEDYNYYKMEKSCVPYDDIVNYIGNGKTGYGWNISNLKIYDKPKELDEFRTICRDAYCQDDYGTPTWFCKDGYGSCAVKDKEKEFPYDDECIYFDCPCYGENCEYEDYAYCLCNGLKPITRPPQSWCYVEEK